MSNLPPAVKARNNRKAYANRKKQKSLSLGNAYEISDIFRQKNWMEYDGYEYILEKYIHLLEKMNEDQSNLFLELTKRFYWKLDYRKEIVAQLNRILLQFKNYSHYYILRCVKRADQKKVKSQGSVAYEIRNPLIQSQLKRPVILLHNMKELESKAIDFRNSLFILVDDFVGTGDSAEQCIDELLKLNGEKKNRDFYEIELEGRIVMMCVAALRQGVNRLSNRGICVFADYIQDRGISDQYTGYKLIRNTQLMEEIEDTFGIKGEKRVPYKFGYKRSEALICMKRCPNNTFPIYWLANNAPYPR